MLLLLPYHASVPYPLVVRSITGFSGMLMNEDNNYLVGIPVAVNDALKSLGK